MNLVTINGSPRKNGCSANLLDMIKKGVLENGGSVEQHHINTMNIKGCQACMACRKLDRCVVEDDMKSVYKDIDEADAVAIGIPIYFHEMSAQVKLVLDRFYAYQCMSEDFKFSSTLKANKKCILVISYANPSRDVYEDYINSITNVFSGLGFEAVEVIVASDSSSEHPEYSQACYELGQSF